MKYKEALFVSLRNDIYSMIGLGLQ